MFFCILFSYTILRDTKDVLVRASTCPASALLCSVTRRPAGLWTSPPRAITTAQPAYPALTAYPALQALLA